MSFPHLASDISSAPSVQEGEYLFKAFSIGERGANISPELSHEVVAGLIAAVNKIGVPDSIVSIHVTGAMWALPVAMALGKPLKLFTTEPNGEDWQQSFEQKRPYLPRQVYTPNLKGIGKCVIIDDVLSRGGTITQMKTFIENAGGIVLGAVCVIDKFGSALSLGENLKIPVITLV